MLVRVSSPLYDRDNNLVITQITIGLIGLAPPYDNILFTN